MSSSRNPESGSQYDYQMFAFVHPEAANCSLPSLQRWGYTVLVRDTPINVTDIRGPYREVATKNGCCGEKEWLKLYAYTLLDYPVVVHLDLDCLILQPLDELFDAIITNHLDPSRVSVMWPNATIPPQIDAFFTRDYNMVRPGKRRPDQIGVQGGFLVVRPNHSTYDEFVQLVLEGNYIPEHGWGGPLRYGGYYGAATIQGLAAYYYGHYRPNRAVELDRCRYNNMVDADRSTKPGVEGQCFTPDSVDCIDCRSKALSEVKSAHFTVCWKPWRCVAHPQTVWQPGTERLCTELHRGWFRMRQELEERIMNGIVVDEGQSGTLQTESKSGAQKEQQPQRQQKPCSFGKYNPIQ